MLFNCFNLTRAINYLEVTPLLFKFIEGANFSSNACNALIHRIHPLNNFIEPENCIV
jgi:hypothetical protein